MRYISLRAALAALLALVGLAALAPAAPAAAQERQRCFPETGLCVRGRILDYWERNGGLAVFGFPIAEQRTERVEGTWEGPVQWFERDRLEDHSGEGQGVLAGRLGAGVLELQGRRWQSFPRAAERPAECRYFEVTGHTLCGVFLRYWERNGGLERFGYPVSEPVVETIAGWTGSVQYFERRRMEHHQELAGTDYEVLLGLLGRDVLFSRSVPACQGPREVPAELEQRIGKVLFRNALTCPAQSYHYVPAAFQPFEHGAMIWVDLGADGRRIIVTRAAGRPAPQPTYGVYPDEYREGDPAVPGTPPPGLYVPQRGFGKVWQGGSRGEGQWVGYALTPEQPQMASVQYFGGGGLVVHLLGSNQVWVFGPRNDELAQV